MRQIHEAGVRLRPMLSAMRGFTLVEAIIVMTITGIIGAVVAIFIRSPVDAYFDLARRAELADLADLTLRRMSRDLRAAVPKTMRVTMAGSTHYVEFLGAKTGGRYLHDDNCFKATTCSSITTNGSVVPTSNGATVTTSDSLIINNQYNNASGGCSTSNPSAYCGQNIAALTAIADNGTADVFSFAATQFYPTGGSENRRFQISDGPVSYKCDPVAGTLTRYSGYAIAATQPTAALTGGNLLATKVSRCQFDYTGEIFDRWGLIGLRIGFTDSGETVELYHEVHINNVP